MCMYFGFPVKYSVLCALFSDLAWCMPWHALCQDDPCSLYMYCVSKLRHGNPTKHRFLHIAYFQFKVKFSAHEHLFSVCIVRKFMGAWNTYISMSVRTSISTMHGPHVPRPPRPNRHGSCTVSTAHAHASPHGQRRANAEGSDRSPACLVYRISNCTIWGKISISGQVININLTIQDILPVSVTPRPKTTAVWLL